jgi:hypothetical protein
VTPSALEATPPDLELPAPGGPVPGGAKAVGSRVGVWWIDDQQYYYGSVRQFDAETGGRKISACCIGPSHRLMHCNCLGICDEQFHYGSVRQFDVETCKSAFLLCCLGAIHLLLSYTVEMRLLEK